MSLIYQVIKPVIQPVLAAAYKKSLTPNKVENENIIEYGN